MPNEILKALLQHRSASLLARLTEKFNLLSQLKFFVQANLNA